MNFKITFFWRMEQQTDFVQFLKCTYSTVLEPARPIRLREQRMQRGARRTPVASWHARCTYASGARRHCGRLEFLAGSSLEDCKGIVQYCSAAPARPYLHARMAMHAVWYTATRRDCTYIYLVCTVLVLYSTYLVVYIRTVLVLRSAPLYCTVHKVTTQGRWTRKDPGCACCKCMHE